MPVSPRVFTCPACGHRADRDFNAPSTGIAERGERGIELAKAGVICGWIFSVVQGLFLIVWCGFAVAFIASAVGHAGQ